MQVLTSPAGSPSLVLPPGSLPNLPLQTLHVGDRFTLSGNDTATRDMCSVLWVANPEETGFFIKVRSWPLREGKEGMLRSGSGLLGSRCRHAWQGTQHHQRLGFANTISALH